jgi:hypothetical protein
MVLGTSKQVWHLEATQSVRRALPLEAMYVLSDPGPSRRRRSADQITVEPLSGGEAFLEVIRSAFNLLVLGRERYANQFHLATRVVAQVPVRRLTYARDFSLLPAVCETILAEHQARLATGGQRPQATHSRSKT